MNAWIQTNLIAVIAVVLSAFAILWNIYNSFQDRPKIKIIAKFGFMAGSEKTFLFVDAINKGRRSIHLSSVGLRSDKDDLLNIHTFGLPHELKENTSHSEWFDVDKLRNRTFDFAWYKDQTGRIYKSKSIKKKLNNYFNSEKKEMKNETKK